MNDIEYNKTIWINEKTAVNETHLNNIENAAV